MAHHPTPQPLPAGFRRRFPLELAPDEYARLEAAGSKAGSKRAALLAGLAALEQASAREADAIRAAKDRDSAHARVQALEAREAELEQALAKARKDAATNTARARTVSEDAKTEIAKAVEDAGWAEDLRASEREARGRIEAELADLDARFVDELRCPRCGEFAPSDEWETRRTDKGRLVYHRSCGYHQGGLLDATSVLGRRR